MKFSIDVECTPEEARSFLGLPDVVPLQREMLGEIRRRMMAGLESVEPDALMKQWLPLGLQGMEQFQKMVWSQMAKAAGGPAGRPGHGEKK